MSKDVLKKDKARNQVPPDSAEVPGIEGAYGHKNEVTAATELGRTKTERLNPIGSGVLSDQPREHGNQYPGRAYPPVQKVTTCTPKEGEARKGVTTQTHSNMHELNAHEEKKVGK